MVEVALNGLLRDRTHVQSVSLRELLRMYLSSAPLVMAYRLRLRIADPDVRPLPLILRSFDLLNVGKVEFVTFRALVAELLLHLLLAELPLEKVILVFFELLFRHGSRLALL